MIKSVAKQLTKKRIVIVSNQQKISFVGKHFKKMFGTIQIAIKLGVTKAQTFLARIP